MECKQHSFDEYIKAYKKFVDTNKLLFPGKDPFLGEYIFKGEKNPQLFNKDPAPIYTLTDFKTNMDVFMASSQANNESNKENIIFNLSFLNLKEEDYMVIEPKTSSSKEEFLKNNGYDASKKLQPDLIKATSSSFECCPNIPIEEDNSIAQKIFNVQIVPTGELLANSKPIFAESLDNNSSLDVQQGNLMKQQQVEQILFKQPVPQQEDLLEQSQQQIPLQQQKNVQQPQQQIEQSQDKESIEEKQNEQQQEKQDEQQQEKQQQKKQNGQEQQEEEEIEQQQCKKIQQQEQLDEQQQVEGSNLEEQQIEEKENLPQQQQRKKAKERKRKQQKNKKEQQQQQMPCSSKSVNVEEMRDQNISNESDSSINSIMEAVTPKKSPKAMRKCPKCNTTTTPQWRRSKVSGEMLCNACQIFEAAHQGDVTRPPRLIERKTQKRKREG